MIGRRNSDPGSKRPVARVQTNRFQSAGPRRERSIDCPGTRSASCGPEGDRPGDRSMEQLLELVLERVSFDLDPEHQAGGAPAREAGRPVGSEDHAGARRGDDLVRSAVTAQPASSDEVDLVGIRMWFGVDSNLGVV